MPRSSNFRLDTKQLFLTFSSLKSTYEDINLKEIHSKFVAFFSSKGGIRSYCIAKEHHSDGTPHVHAAIELWKKYETSNQRCFDGILNHHGKYEGARHYRSGVQYCKKDGDYISSEDEDRLDLSMVPIGRRRRMYEDWKWYQSFKDAEQALPITWPVRVRGQIEPSSWEFTEFEMGSPDVSVKNRNWWIVGPPNMGKTRWLNDRFKNQKVFIPVSNDFPFEGYMDEELIVLDDHTLPFHMIASILNKHDIKTPLPGKIRFQHQYWKLGSVRNIIVLSNKSISELGYEKNLEAMKARFTEIYNPQFVFTHSLDILDMPLPNLPNIDSLQSLPEIIDLTQ